jgi:hypothetical protein
MQCRVEIGIRGFACCNGVALAVGRIGSGSDKIFILLARAAIV